MRLGAAQRNAGGMKSNPNAHYSRPIYGFAHVLRFVRAVKSPDFSHARCHPVSPNSLEVYHRSTWSPSGVISAAGIDREYGEEILERLGRSAAQLSPTEGRRA